jgi:hypothetical protein
MIVGHNTRFFLCDESGSGVKASHQRVGIRVFQTELQLRKIGSDAKSGIESKSG